MKILWFSNCKLSNKNNKLSGSWLYSMSELLTAKADIMLTNITVDGSNTIKSIQKIQIAQNFEEYILPNWKRDEKGFPNKKFIERIKEICINTTPDLIHIWGIENYFCNLIPEFNLNCPLLLEIQGLHEPCVEVFYGDLSLYDTLSCLGLREILLPTKKSIYADKKRMKELIKYDKLALKKYQFISTQSRWVRDYVRFNNINAHIFQTRISIRAPFWNASWKYPDNNQKNFYCSAAGPSSYKCIQTAIKALHYVNSIYPESKLFIIGDFKRKNWLHQPGYLTYLYKLIKKFNLTNNIIFTGSLTANEIVDIMQKCIAMIQTSYVESYSLALVEAQAAGVPAIISYAGAMPELAEDRKSGLFFSPGDYISCANRMIELIENKELALSLSNEGFSSAQKRNNDQIVLSTQIQIYKSILIDQPWHI